MNLVAACMLMTAGIAATPPDASADSSIIRVPGTQRFAVPDATNCEITIIGGLYHQASAVSLFITVDDGTLTEMLIGNDAAFTDATWQTLASTMSWELEQGEGSRTVWLKCRDASGNTSAAASDTVIVDSTPPTNQSVGINGGQFFTSNTMVTLALAASDPNLGHVQLSPDMPTDTTPWWTFSNSVPWTIAAGDGTKHVYARFRDLAANLSTVVHAAIDLDQTRPEIASVLVTGYVRAVSTTVEVAFVDVTAGMDTAVQPTITAITANNKTSLLAAVYYMSNVWRGTMLVSTGQDGVASLNVSRGADRAGNVMTACPGVVSFIVDTKAPTNLSLIIDGGAAYALRLPVQLSLHAEDSAPMDMVVGNDPAFSDGEWESFVPMKAWYLPGTDGVKRVCVGYRDAAGNITTTLSATVTLATTPPAMNAVSKGSYTNRIIAVWAANNGAAHYDVYRNTTNDLASATLVTSVLVATFTDYDVRRGDVYWYWVRSVNAQGATEIGNSDYGYVRIGSVAGVTASDGAFTSMVRVAWLPTEPGDQYTVYRDDSMGIVKVATVSTTVYDDVAVLPGTNYTYWVRVLSGIAEGDWGQSDPGFVLLIVNLLEGEWKYRDAVMYDIIKGKSMSPTLAPYLLAGWSIGIATVTNGDFVNFYGPDTPIVSKNLKSWILKRKYDVAIKYYKGPKPGKDLLIFQLYQQMPSPKMIYLLPPGMTNFTPGKAHATQLLVPVGGTDAGGWRTLVPQPAQ